MVTSSLLSGALRKGDAEETCDRDTPRCGDKRGHSFPKDDTGEGQHEIRVLVGYSGRSCGGLPPCSICKSILLSLSGGGKTMHEKSS